MIRVQTVHMSKGDEAKNSAVIVNRGADFLMLGSDPRLSYVALTRASYACYPRVCDPHLISELMSNRYWAPHVKAYLKMFPIING